MSKSSASRPRASRTRIGLFVASLLGALTVASSAAAHLDLAGTDPQTGSTVAAAVDAVTLSFTADATPSGPGVEIFGGDGQPVPLSAIEGGGSTTWVARPLTPLESGTYGVKWQLAGPDGHAMAGTVLFTVAVPVTAPAVAAPADPQATTPTAPPSPGTPATPEAAIAQPPALALALREPDDRPWSLLGTGGRWLSYAAALISIGGLLVAVSTFVGSRGDLAVAQVLIRSTGVLAAFGAVIEIVALVGVFGPSVPLLSAGAAVARLAGGVLIAVAGSLSGRQSGGRRSRNIRALPVAVGGGAGGGRSHAVPYPLMAFEEPRLRVVAERRIAVVVAGALLLGSFLLDGHTASTQPWLVMAGADLAHTVAAAVWLGGVTLLAVLLITRARAGVPTGAGELAVRFSVPATAAAATVGVAGALMLILIVDTPADLFTTAWGRVMLVKLAAVACVAVVGYLNNRYTVPALDNWRPGTARMLRRTVALEGLLMLVVLVTTAMLVSAEI